MRPWNALHSPDVQQNIRSLTMNKTSLYHNFIKNQHEFSSWTEDPFDLKGALKGHRHLDNQRILEDHLQYLVQTYGKYTHYNFYVDMDMLPDEEQYLLAKLYIESIDRNIEWACYGNDESINSSFLCSLLTLLTECNNLTKEQFAETVRNNVITYYKDTLNKLLEKGCEMCMYFENESNYNYNAYEEE